jgi:hypothetical protein
LRHGSRDAISLAVTLAILTDMLTRTFKVLDATSPALLLVECGGVSFLVGRASGFWSADRRLRKNEAAEKAGADT